MCSGDVPIAGFLAAGGVREAVLLGIGEIIERNGAEIAFPTRTLKAEMAEA
jgi:hypothetical protein